MNILICALEAAFGTNAVRVRDSHCVRVRNLSSGTGWHSIWVRDQEKEPAFVLRLHGKRSAFTSSSHKEIVARINQYQENRILVADIHEALKIGECFQHAQRVLLDRSLDYAIFVDGGWKNKKAKIAAVWVAADGDIDVRVRVIECETSAQTEIRAVLLGYELRQDHGDQDTPIFTDCRAALGHCLISHIANVQWVPRLRNKAADRLSNMRALRR